MHKLYAVCHGNVWFKFSKHEYYFNGRKYTRPSVFIVLFCQKLKCLSVIKVKLCLVQHAHRKSTISLMTKHIQNRWMGPLLPTMTPKSASCHLTLDGSSVPTKTGCKNTHTGCPKFSMTSKTHPHTNVIKSYQFQL